MKIKFDYIDSDAQLIAFSRKISSAKWLAIDTEFMRERTYYAQLALIQVATEDSFALIDAPALSNLEPLLDAFTRSDCLKIMHSASQDLEVLYQALGQMPAPLFDTQIAASFLGEPDQIAYGAIVKQRLGIELDKGQTRTNWLQRPLSAAQISYAEADVLHLYELYEQLVAELSTLNRLDWVYDESNLLAEKTLNGFASELAWQRLKGISRLTPQQQNSAVCLATWREQRAQSRDLPREWILKKQILITLAKLAPNSLQALKNIEGMNDKLANRIGKQVLKIIAETPQEPVQFIAQTELSSEQRQQTKKLMAWVRNLGEKEKIAPALIANRAVIEQFITGKQDLPLFHGWRATLVGNTLLKMRQTDTLP